MVVFKVVYDTMRHVVGVHLKEPRQEWVMQEPLPGI
jgi:hypothetical protein